MIYETDLKGVIAGRWSIRARTYDLSPGHGIHSEHEKKAWVNILSEALDHRTNLAVLDVGTGTGALALLLAEMNHKVVGIDLSEKMLARAREKARTASLTADFKIGDAEAPPWKTNPLMQSYAGIFSGPSPTRNKRWMHGEMF